MRITVFGAGGVGGYFGGRLAVAGHEVHLIARGGHLTALQEHGLRVNSVRGGFQVHTAATDDPAAIGPCDVVLFCVKSYDTAAAAARLGPLLADGTAVVSLQNGVDNESKLAEVIGWPHVVGGASFIFAAITEPGLVDHTGGPASLVFGEFADSGTSAGPRSDRVLALADACRAADIPTDVPDDIRAVLWSKFAFICAQAGMTATTQRPIGEIRDSEPAWRMFRAIVAEAVAVARAEEVPLPDAVIEDHLRFATGLEPTGRSSLYTDLATGHRMELEALHGTLSRLGAKHGVPTPAADAVYAILSPAAAQADHAGP